MRKASQTKPTNPQLDQCDREILQIETLLRDGHPDTQGLLMALQDWNAERRLIESEITSFT